MIGAETVLSPTVLVVVGGVAGLIAGSFIGALVERWPRGETVMRGRSRCDSCGHRLCAGELIPVISHLALCGRCRSCGACIPATHLAAELAAALVGVSAFAAAPPLVALAGALFGWTLVALALLDLRHFWLPDRLTLPLVAGGLGAAVADLTVPLTDSLIGAAAGYGALTLIALAYRRVRGRVGLGGGDPKLLGAIGAWLGWALLPPVLVLASLMGLASLGLHRLRGGSIDRTDRVPLGTLMAIAAWPLWLIVHASWGP